MNIKRFVKYLGACLLRVVNRAFYIFPVKKNRILLNTYDGKHICCNPKSIFEGLMKLYPGEFEYVWTLSSGKELRKYRKHFSGEKIKFVKLRSLRFYIMKATAKVCIVNSACFPEMPLRPSQFQVYTHHGGGAYKTAGAAIVGADTRSNLRKLRWDAENISLFLSSSEYFTNEVIRKQKLYQGEVYEYGMPRNDRLVRRDFSTAKNVRNAYGLDEDKHIILYAPTYKAPSKNEYEPIDIEAALEAAQKRFGGEWVFLLRTHYLGKGAASGENIISATDYPDMQELLAAADILISDYSSSIWDFSFTGKPCLLYTPDVDEYISNRGLDTPIDTWGFPVCRTNDELCSVIGDWDEESFAEKMQAHHDNLGACETGHATVMVCRRIHSECFGTEE